MVRRSANTFFKWVQFSFSCLVAGAEESFISRLICTPQASFFLQVEHWFIMLTNVHSNLARSLIPLQSNGNIRRFYTGIFHYILLKSV